MNHDNGDQQLRRGNLLWEGSRMFLPEHREQLLSKRRSRNEFRMPDLDEDWKHEMERALAASLEHRIPVSIVYGTKYETRRCTGVVKQIDPYEGWVKIVCGGNEGEGDDGGVGEQVRRIAFQRIVEIREI